MPSQVSVDAARSVIEDPPDRPFDFGLEAIILVMGRPVLLVQNDDFDLATLETDTWRTRLEKARQGLRSALFSVGRVDLDNNPRFDWVGTGWVVSTTSSSPTGTSRSSSPARRGTASSSRGP